MDVRKITFEVVGPITRSTVGNEVPDPDEEALNDLLHWVWSWRLQVSRLGKSTEAQYSEAKPLDQRRSRSAASYDEHALAVVGWNLARAVARAGKRFPLLGISGATYEALRLLRDLYEHWDEQRPPFHSGEIEKKFSGRNFAEQFPEGKPWSITYAQDDWLLGGVVPINELTRELEPIEKATLRIEEERKVGQT